MGDDSYLVPVAVRMRDIDFMGHVNNALYATYLEEARESFYRDAVDASLAETDTVLANLEIDYRRPIHADDDVVVALRVDELGESSIPIEYEIRADGDVAATARTVQVLIDRERGRSRPLSDEWRTALGEYGAQFDDA